MSMLPGVLGQTAFNVAGHKVPYGAIAAVAGVAGVVLVLRARSSGGSLVNVGSSGATPSDLANYGNSFGPDYSGSLANLSQQVSDLSALVSSMPQSPAAAAAPAPAPAASGPAPALAPVTVPAAVAHPAYVAAAASYSPPKKKPTPIYAPRPVYAPPPAPTYSLEQSWPVGPPRPGKVLSF